MNLGPALALLCALPSGSVTAIIGLPRCGKSTLVQRADLDGAFPRRVVFDPYNRRDRIEATRGKPVSPWNGRVLSSADLCRNPDVLDRDPLALVVCDSHDLSSRWQGQAFSRVARLLWATGGVDLICEEAGLYSRHAVELGNQLATGGGHVGMRLICVVQSLSRLHIDFRRSISAVISFAQTEADDLKALAGRCGKRFAAQVAALPPRGAPPLLWTQGQRSEPS